MDMDLLKKVEGEIERIQNQCYKSIFDLGFLEAMELVKYDLDNKLKIYNDGQEEQNERDNG